MRTRAADLAIVSLALLPPILLAAGSAQAQIPDKFTNLQVLSKEIAKPELLETMKGFSMSLGVRCTYCHVGEEKPGVPPFTGFQFAPDDKAPKATARAMMKMMSDVNLKYLSEIRTGRDARVQVSCMTCHRGVAVPQPIGQLLLETIREKGIEAGTGKYRELRGQHLGGMAYDFGEAPLSEVARALIADKKVEDALSVAKLNAEFHPASARSQFALGEIYAAKGDKASAADAYRKALELEPGLEPAKKRLAEVTKGGS